MKNIRFARLLCGVLMAGLLASCMGMEDVDPSSLSMPEVKAFNVKDNGSLVFELSATVDKSVASRIAECGFYYGKDKSMSDAERIKCKMTSNSFSADLTLHEYGQTYYICSYISNGSGSKEILSDPERVQLKDLDAYVEFGAPEVVSYDRATKIAAVRLNYAVRAGVEVTAGGICYGSVKNLSVGGLHIEDKNLDDKSLNAELHNLEAGETFFVRPYFYDGDALAYGEVTELDAWSVPVVETSSVTGITKYGAVCGGNIVDDGGSEVTARGVVWSTSPDSVVSLSTKTSDGTGAGMFTSTISGLLPGTKYYVRAYATNSRGVSYGDVHTFTTSYDLMDASNCFIISKSGTYAFKPVKGNSSESVGSVKSVEVLWESFGTSVTPKVGDLVESVSYVDGSIIFQTSSTFREGNAVIAAKDASGKILWSWHIWLTDAPGECVYANNAGTMMDRNLGATSATPGEAGALGLLYQWGRKDPFLGSSSISSDVEAKSTISWPSPVSSSSSRGTIGYAVEHPTTFITNNDSNNDWYYTGSSSTDNTRWQSEKTIYDPCPAGWRVPDGGSNGVWHKAGFDDQSYDSSNEGMLFGSGISSPATWYPASGVRYSNVGSLFDVGYRGHYWSVTPDDYFACIFYLYSNGYVYPTDGSTRAYGQSVRCLQE